MCERLRKVVHVLAAHVLAALTRLPEKLATTTTNAAIVIGRTSVGHLISSPFF